MDNDRFEVALSKLEGFIRQRKMRQTPERRAILAKALGMDAHFDVDDLYNAIVGEYHVSRSTVYKNVELFCQCNILRKHFLSENLAVYELAGETHLHLICQECGKVRVVRDAELSARLLSMKFRGFAPAYFSANVYGLCTSCQRKLKKERGGVAPSKK